MYIIQHPEVKGDQNIERIFYIAKSWMRHHQGGFTVADVNAIVNLVGPLRGAWMRIRFMFRSLDEPVTVADIMELDSLLDRRRFSMLPQPSILNSWLQNKKWEFK